MYGYFQNLKTLICGNLSVCTRDNASLSVSATRRFKIVSLVKIGRCSWSLLEVLVALLSFIALPFRHLESNKAGEFVCNSHLTCYPFSVHEKMGREFRGNRGLPIHASQTLSSVLWRLSSSGPQTRRSRSQCSTGALEACSKRIKPCYFRICLFEGPTNTKNLVRQ